MFTYGIPPQNMCRLFVPYGYLTTTSSKVMSYDNVFLTRTCWNPKVTFVKMTMIPCSTLFLLSRFLEVLVFFTFTGPPTD